MKGKVRKNEEIFLVIVGRINRYFIFMNFFYILYFILNPEVNIYLFFLALLNAAFTLLSIRHHAVTKKLVDELHKLRIESHSVSKHPSAEEIT